MHHSAKRRRTNVNVYASTVDLTITAEECRVQQRSLHEGSHLIQLLCTSANSSSWKDDGDTKRDTRKQPMHFLMVDRYDARALMDELSLQQLCHRHMCTLFNADGVINKASSRCLHRSESEEEGSREEMDQRNIERFGMLPAEYQSCTTSQPGVEEKDKKANEHHDTSENNKEINDEPFELTEEQRYTLPHDVMLPRTKRQHNIIELTAARVANNPQLEIFLRLKQSSNTLFSFINPADDLHPYYLHLKVKCSGENTILSNEAGKRGLDGLLAGYSSSCSDEDVGSTASISRDQDNDVQRRQTERLERLRKWKASKNL
ncbi:hypothetical protein ACHAXM_002948 [Skeletonema potamos]